MKSVTRDRPRRCTEMTSSFGSTSGEGAPLPGSPPNRCTFVGDVASHQLKCVRALVDLSSSITPHHHPCSDLKHFKRSTPRSTSIHDDQFTGWTCPTSEVKHTPSTWSERMERLRPHRPPSPWGTPRLLSLRRRTTDSEEVMQMSRYRFEHHHADPRRYMHEYRERYTARNVAMRPLTSRGQGCDESHVCRFKLSGDLEEPLGRMTLLHQFANQYADRFNPLDGNTSETQTREQTPNSYTATQWPPVKEPLPFPSSQISPSVAPHADLLNTPVAIETGSKFSSTPADTTALRLSSATTLRYMSSPIGSQHIPPSHIQASNHNAPPEGQEVGQASSAPRCEASQRAPEERQPINGSSSVRSQSNLPPTEILSYSEAPPNRRNDCSTSGSIKLNLAQSSDEAAGMKSLREPDSRMVALCTETSDRRHRTETLQRSASARQPVRPTHVVDLSASIPAVRLLLNANDTRYATLLTGPTIQRSSSARPRVPLSGGSAMGFRGDEARMSSAGFYFGNSGRPPRAMRGGMSSALRLGLISHD